MRIFFLSELLAKVIILYLEKVGGVLMTVKKIELSKEAKEKILLFFLKTSVPRILMEQQKLKKAAK